VPITGQGWEFHVERTDVQYRVSDGKPRTVGTYQVYHDGTAVQGLTGTTAESRGPGNNAVARNGCRVEAGRYPLATQAGTKYKTHDYTSNPNQAALPRPGLELRDTGNRSEILIHPGLGFLASIGCINLCEQLPSATDLISFADSRTRVIAIIDDLRNFLGAAFPSNNGLPIPNAFAVIDHEP
jgi:hypothetical protein